MTDVEAIIARVLGTKRAYDKADPRRGDVVIFRDPEHWRQNCIKRIVALPGDTVHVQDGRVTVYAGIARERSPAEAVGTSSSQPPPSNVGVTVSPHHCFVVGDNPANSRDSRQFGPIPFATILARADYVYWPEDSWYRVGRLDRAERAPRSP